MFSTEDEQIIYKMTNFYQNHLPSDSSFEKILSVYRTLLNAVADDFRYVDASTVVDSTKTLSTIPYFKIDISDGVYSTSDAIRIKDLGFEDCIQYLNTNQKYVTLTFLQQGYEQSVVFSMDLKVSFGATNSLILYDHYFIRDNKLYLMPSFILQYERIKRYLHGFNIKVNRKTLERNWGSMFNISTGPLLPRSQYRNALSGFYQVLTSDLTIKSITEGISKVTEWPDFAIKDIKSPNLTIPEKRMYDEFMLSPARFLVSLPESLIKDKMRLNMLLDLLDEAKMAHTNYLVLYHVMRQDVQQIPDISRQLISMTTKESHTPNDNMSYALSMKYTDMIFNLFNGYDYDLYYDSDPLHYDTKRQYDFYFPCVTFSIADQMSEFHDSLSAPKISARFGEFMSFENESIPTYDGSLLFDSDYDYDFMDTSAQFDIGSEFDGPILPQADYFKVKQYTFPEIPRNFSAGRDATSGSYDFYCRPNTDGTISFELYGSADEDGTYDLLSTLPNDTTLEKITFVDDANVSGKRYYKVRAVAGSSTSMMTLPIDIQTI